MKSEDQLNYPLSFKLRHKLWLHTCFHPFGFSVSDDGRPCIDIRISSESLIKLVSVEERIEFMMESHRRMLELGYIAQSNKDPVEFMKTTQAHGVLWYWLPNAIK